MNDTYDIQIEYYGIVIVKINHQNHCVNLTLKRYAQPILSNQVEKVMKWALCELREKYPDYTIVKEVTHEE
jgi:hypothetical protein